VRPLGIVLSIVSATIVLSYPWYSQSSSVWLLLGIGILLMVAAIIAAVLEDENQDADAARLVKATEANAVEISRLTFAILSSKGASPPPPPPQAAERYCPSCGAGHARGSAFCDRCGNPLPPSP
jgi:hypothetical protein